MFSSYAVTFDTSLLSSILDQFNTSNLDSVSNTSSVSQNQPKEIRKKKKRKRFGEYKDLKTKKAVFNALAMDIESIILEEMSVEQFWKEYLAQKGKVSEMIKVLKEIGEKEWKNEVEVSLLHCRRNID